MEKRKNSTPSTFLKNSCELFLTFLSKNPTFSHFLLDLRCSFFSSQSSQHPIICGCYGVILLSKLWNLSYSTRPSKCFLLVCHRHFFFLSFFLFTHSFSVFRAGLFEKSFLILLRFSPHFSWFTAIFGLFTVWICESPLYLLAPNSTFCRDFLCCPDRLCYPVWNCLHKAAHGSVTNTSKSWLVAVRSVCWSAWLLSSQ